MGQVPSAFVGGIVEELAAMLEPGDTIIDGGNSYYRDDVDRARTLETRGVEYVDVGTSGGIYGRERGFCLMIGGNDAPVARLEPVFRSLAPGVEAAPRTASPIGSRGRHRRRGTRLSALRRSRSRTLRKDDS